MSFIKRTFRPIYHFFLLLRILNVHKTIYINLKYLPWGQALRFPIFVFGRLKIQRSDNGGIEIRHARICRGMIKIGKNIDGHYSHNLPVELILSQKLIFQGYAWISGGTMIETYRGTIDIGNFCVIGSGTMLKSESGIILGNLTRIAYCSTIMDTNVHFIKNTKTGKVNNSSAPISIGIGCWINAFSFISKGAILPNHCITARNSMVNKDYSTVCSPGTFLAGEPAKPIASDLQRIFSSQSEQHIREQFRLNGNPETITLSEEMLLTEESTEDLEAVFGYIY